ncbi:MAG: SpoIID/LytB domain-containing protein [Armatimonadota bacterium]
MIFLIFAVFCFAAVFSYKKNTFINVGLSFNAAHASFRADSPFKVFNGDTGGIITQTRYVKVVIYNGRFEVNNKAVSCVKLKIVPGESPVGLHSGYGYTPYRGNFILYKESPYTFLVINQVDINEYITSVLGGEVSYTWPMESLRAQAVAARTYALYKKEKNLREDKKPFDVVATIRDQVYKGIRSENKICREAVYSTDNLVMKYKGDVIRAYYHSNCGGFTQTGSTVFEDGGNYLKGVKCFYCSQAPVSKWNKTITADQIKKILTYSGETVGKIYLIVPVYNQSSGRLEDIIVFHTKGASLLAGSDLRAVIGPYNLKSTNFEMSVHKSISLPESLARKKFGLLYVKNSGIKDMPEENFDNLYIPLEAKYSKEKISVINGGGQILRKDPLGINIRNDLGLFTSTRPVYLIFAAIADEVSGESFAFGALPDIFNAEGGITVPVSFLLKGKGWGHGLGMCQWGAYGMAKSGYTFAEILHHYYTGISLEPY